MERFLSHISVKDGGNQKVPKIGASNTLGITICPSPKYWRSRKIYIKLVNTVNTNLEQKSVTSIIPKIITKSTENRFWKNLGGLIGQKRIRTKNPQIGDLQSKHNAVRPKDNSLHKLGH